MQQPMPYPTPGFGDQRTLIPGPSETDREFTILDRETFEVDPQDLMARKRVYQDWLWGWKISIFRPKYPELPKAVN